MSLLVEGLFSLVVVYYAAYALLELRMVLLSRGREEPHPADFRGKSFSPPFSSLPTVTVLLPVYNESQVVERLIDAVCRLDYPDDKFEVLILDNSTDATTTLAANRVAVQAASGRNIRLLCRVSESGDKAGTLIKGIKLAKGDFLAIFDADFIPPTNFLRRTIPCFEDPEIGFLQTAIGYTNRDASFLTRYQAMEMGHQQFVTAGLSHAGLMGSLSGSSCVWRRTCVERIGGWSTETITEDVDLGYRAQLERWKYIFLPEVISLSELPETMSAFRVQRDRWARGLIHNAFRHLRSMLATSMSPVQRLYAISMMFSSLLLASFFVLVLLSLPLTLMTADLGAFFKLNCLLFLFAVLIWALGNFLGSRKGARMDPQEPWWKSAVQMYAYVAMFLPMSLYYFGAGLQVLAGREGAFNRTPKGRTVGQTKKPAVNTILAAMEWIMLVYSGITLSIGLLKGNYWTIPFSMTALIGFALVVYFSGKERQVGRAG